MNKIYKNSLIGLYAIQIVLVAVQIIFSQDTPKSIQDSSGKYSVKIVNDSIAVIKCTDSTFVKGKIVAESRYEYLVENEYLGYLKIRKKKMGNDSVLAVLKNSPAPDPRNSSTFLYQSAFIQRVYPVEINNTMGIFNSIRASITPYTLISINFTIPHNYRDISFGVKQQLYQTPQKKLAVALSGTFTHVTKSDYPVFWQSDRAKMQYIVDGGLILSMKFFHNGYFHTGLLYTMQKRYFHYWTEIDGMEYHEFKDNYYQHWGFMGCVEFQPIKYVKLFLDYSAGYGIFVNNLLDKNYYCSIGSRFLIDRVTLDFGLCQRANLKSYVLFPIGRLSVFLGSFKHLDNKK